VSTLIEARGIVKRFSGNAVLKGVDFELLPGEIHSLVGENGAGKSTLVNILTGLLSPDEGELRVRGKPVRFDSPREARLAGIHVIHQELTFAPGLSVATNIALGALPLRDSPLGRLFGLVDRDEVMRRARRALEKANTVIDPAAPAGRLSVAQAQLLEIARALDGDFQVILFDEPTSSLGPRERDELFVNIRRLRASGIGILYISHRLDEILGLSDRITVLRDGAIVASGVAGEFDTDRIVRSMTGSAMRQVAARSSEPGEVILEVRGLSSPPHVEHAEFSLRRGEIVGMAGLVGAGRTEVAGCVYGVRPVATGEIRFEGKTVAPKSPSEALGLGIGYATEDRKGAGIFHMLNVETNISTGALARPNVARRFTYGTSWLKRGSLRALAGGLLKELNVRPPNAKAIAGTLSGGNQQKVMFARLIAGDLRVLMLDEPTRGVDVGAKAQIWQLIRRLADEGMGILAISSDIPELIGNVDRVLVMRRGRIVAEVAGDDVSEDRLMRHMV
jgi:ABC-type sugar transport system ATPase subunit